MENKKNIQEEDIFNATGSFKDTNKDNPFKVPANYFDNLQELIIKKCINSKNISVENRIRTFILRPAFSLSFIIIAVLIILAVSFYNKTINNKNNTSISSYQNEKSIEDYLIENENIDDSFIVDAISDDSTNSDNIFITNETIAYESGKTGDYKQNDKPADTTISNDEIMNYLLEENIDPNEL